jgi:endonuclease YncB( thermonuclease family)
LLLLNVSVAALFFAHGLCFAEDYVGRIVGVMDGDTVDLLTDSRELIRVRLSGIDAPEKRQAFGNVAKKALSDLTFHRRVEISGHKRDRWGRVVGKVTASGIDANLQMVKRGLAWHYKKYQKEQPLEDRQVYAEAELAAKSKHLGLWADKEPVPPWEFRAGKQTVNGLL